ncbi:MAG: CRISPR-associated helicase Cas3' [Treponemataceae bacterium]|nr:CRISPR-associated helicase Cas3' [Treponemataceae bacterium]
MDEILARWRNTEPNYQKLSDHLQETGVFCYAFGKDIGFPEIAEISGLLHDVGKSTKTWQLYLISSVNGNTRSKKDHATAGGQLINDLFPNESKLIVVALEAVVMYHHGLGLPDFISPDGSSEFKKRLEKDIEETELDEVKTKLLPFLNAKISNFITSEKFFDDGKKALLFPCKRKTKSNKQVFFNMGMHLRNLSSCLIDADRSDSAAFEENRKIELSEYSKIPNWDKLLLKLEKYLSCVSSENELGKIRTSLSEKCKTLGRGEKGIFTCSAVTGAGKTFASLRFALEQAIKFNMKHIFVIAPYTSILDQNAEEIRKVLENEETKGQIVLECHSNLSVEKKEYLMESENNYSRFEENWNSPVIITTMVQFLESLFASGTKKIGRMHQLANSVLIFDEIQTLPLKTTYLFNWGVEYLVNVCSCSAMLCTATQPGLDKIGKEADKCFRLRTDGEVIDNLSEHFNSLKRVNFIDMTSGGLKSHTANDICDYIKTQMKKINSFLAVVNTKPQASELFDLVKNSGCAEFVYHLSTNMCPAHRKRVIEEIKDKLETGNKIVCISTRLIEAGVDLSFQGALRYMAGLDSIIQTAGRCNRHNELKDEAGQNCHGQVAIFSYKDEKLGSLEELKIGQDCMGRILRDYPAEKETKNCNLIHPDVIYSYFKYFYGSLPDSLLKYSIKNHEASVLDMLSDNQYAVQNYEDNYGKQWPYYYRQAFKTAWENFEVIADATTGIIVPYGEGENLSGEYAALEKMDKDYYKNLKNLLKKSQQYTVNVYSNQLEKLGKAKMIYEVYPQSGIYVLDKSYYNEEKGLSYEIVESSGNLLNF